MGVVLRPMRADEFERWLPAMRDRYAEDGHRGRGYGKAAMLFAEEEARRRGLDRVGLNVFGGNEVARAVPVARLRRERGRDEQARLTAPQGDTPRS